MIEWYYLGAISRNWLEYSRRILLSATAKDPSEDQAFPHDRFITWICFSTKKHEFETQVIKFSPRFTCSFSRLRSIEMAFI